MALGLHTSQPCAETSDCRREVVFCGENERLLSAGQGLGEIKFRLENASMCILLTSY